MTELDRPFGLQEVESHRISIQLAYEDGKVVRPAAFTLQETQHSFLLGAESIQGTQCDRKD